MMRLGKLLILIFLFPLAAGCATCEVVEAELRYQANRVEVLERKLALRDAELESLRERPGVPDPTLGSSPTHSSEAAKPSANYDPLSTTIVKVNIGQQSGVRDLDRDGREDSLHVFLSPVDAVGDSIKVPARVEIEAYQLGDTGITQGLGVWKFDEADLVGRWRPSVLGAGYQFVIPWRETPTSAMIRIKARLTTVSGRAFESSKDVPVSRTNSLFRNSDPNGTSPSRVPPPKKTSSTLRLLPPCDNSTGLGETWLPSQVIDQR